MIVDGMRTAVIGVTGTRTGHWVIWSMWEFAPKNCHINAKYSYIYFVGTVGVDVQNAVILLLIFELGRILKSSGKLER